MINGEPLNVIELLGTESLSYRLTTGIVGPTIPTVVGLTEPGNTKRVLYIKPELRQWTIRKELRWKLP